MPAAAIAWTLHLAAAPEPFAVDAALSVALGILIFSVIAVAGILLSRGRWSRWLARAVVTAEALVFVATDPTVAGYTAAGITAAALVAIEGPWLDGWVRKRPSAEGPGPTPIGVVLGGLALTPIVGVASPAGLAVWHGILGAAGVLLAWSYARAMPWSLWAIRVALVPLAVPAIVLSPPAGAVLLSAAVITITALAWAKESFLAVHPMFDRLPGPRSATPGPGPGSGGSGA